MRGAGLAAALLAAALGSGCGGPLSSGDLHNQASSICQTTQHRINRIPTPSSPAQTTRFLDRGIAELGPELTQLRSLTPPAQAAAKFQDALRNFGSQLDRLRSARDQLRSGQDPEITLKTLQASLGPLRDAENRDWDELGISDCRSR